MKLTYNICVIDIGSPKLGNIGWCLFDLTHQAPFTGTDLQELFQLFHSRNLKGALTLALEAPLFIPVRDDPMKMTKARLGEGSRPWSAGAGAQVLALNLPIMCRIFQELHHAYPAHQFIMDAGQFAAQEKQILISEALVSGKHKGISHVDDATIMAKYIQSFSIDNKLPPSILMAEKETTYLNLAAAALIKNQIHSAQQMIDVPCPIFRPDDVN